MHLRSSLLLIAISFATATLCVASAWICTTLVVDVLGLPKGSLRHIPQVLISGTIILLVAAWFRRQVRRANAALQSEQAQLRQFIDGMSHGLIECAEDGRLLLSNPAYLTILGVDAAKVMGQPVWEFAAGAGDKAALQEMLAAAVQGQPSGSVRVQMRRPDGAARVVRLDWTRRQTQEQVRLMAVATDVTEFLLASHRLQDFEQRYQALFEHYSDAVFITDRKGRFTAVNTAATQLLGCPKEALLKLALPSIFVAEERTRANEAFLNTLQGFAQQLSTRLIRSDGRLVHVEITTSPHIVDGQVLGVAGTAKDITARVMAEQELRNSERKYRSLFDQSLDGILLACAGADGEILAANPAACHKLGCTEAEIIRRGKRAFMEPDDPAYAGQPASYHGEYHYRTADGRWFPVEVAGGVFPGRDGRLWIGVTFRDITKRKQSEAELTRSREELRRLSGSLQSVQEAERRRIARELHDELGQCLMALKLDVSWLRDRLPAEAPANLSNKLDQIGDAIDTTVETVRSLAANLRPSILDDLGLTAACEWLLQEFQQRTGIDCHLRVEPEEFALPDAVATASFRVVQEALTNVARHAQAQRVDVHLLRGPDGLKVVVADDGVGLPQSRSRTTLGLVGMRERALALGGRLDLHSGPGEGTRIHLFIPVATEPPGRVELDD